jgi:hypothetical protein
VVTKFCAETVTPVNYFLMLNQAAVWSPRPYSRLWVVKWFGMKVAVKTCHNDVHKSGVGATGF